MLSRLLRKIKCYNRDVLKALLREIIYADNRAHLSQSVAGKAVAALPDALQCANMKKALRKIYEHSKENALCVQLTAVNQTQPVDTINNDNNHPAPLG